MNREQIEDLVLNHLGIPTHETVEWINGIPTKTERVGLSKGLFYFRHKYDPMSVYYRNWKDIYFATVYKVARRYYEGSKKQTPYDVPYMMGLFGLSDCDTFIDPIVRWWKKEWRCKCHIRNCAERHPEPLGVKVYEMCCNCYSMHKSDKLTQSEVEQIRILNRKMGFTDLDYFAQAFHTYRPTIEKILGVYQPTKWEQIQSKVQALIQKIKWIK